VCQNDKAERKIRKGKRKVIKKGKQERRREAC
jgi:hypothetical protein